MCRRERHSSKIYSKSSHKEPSQSQRWKLGGPKALALALALALTLALALDLTLALALTLALTLDLDLALSLSLALALTLALTLALALALTHNKSLHHLVVLLLTSFSIEMLVF